MQMSMHESIAEMQLKYFRKNVTYEVLLKSFRYLLYVLCKIRKTRNHIGTYTYV